MRPRPPELAEGGPTPGGGIDAPPAKLVPLPSDKNFPSQKSPKWEMPTVFGLKLASKWEICATECRDSRGYIAWNVSKVGKWCFLELTVGFEPTTTELQVRCSSG